MDAPIIARIASELSLPEEQVRAVADLFENGATVPFVVRYRKEMSGGIGRIKISAIHERMTYYKEVVARRVSLLKMAAEQGKLTDALQQGIDNSFSRIELDDLHYQFRPRKKTRGTEALAKGLEPLAEYLWNQESDAWSLEEHADVFIDPEKGVASREEALQGASDIIAEWIAENFEYRKVLREMLWKEGLVVSTVVPAKMGQKTKYNMYYDRREPVTTIPSHRVLAIRRGSKEGVLTSSIQGESAKALEFLLSSVIREKDSAFAPVLEKAARDSYFRILRPLIETEVRALLKERADHEAIRVFQDNLANLLLSPACGPIAAIGLDPGKGGECSLAVVGETGNFLEAASLTLSSTESDVENARVSLQNLIARHNVGAIAIRSGAASREVDTALRQIMSAEAFKNIPLAAVNDAGLAVYASSRAAREEFPELSIGARCAVSLARRLQDPLSELVKIDPKLIGVGQYQHDVDQKQLHRSLLQTVQSCVSEVGVDLNTADLSLLRHVSGLNEKLAHRILAARNADGSFTSRAALKAILEETVYQQAAGFLRLRDGVNPLDRTAIHPEAYVIVERMAESSGVIIADLIGNKELISSLTLESFVGEGAGLPTLADIREELLTPGRDPRKKFAAPKFRVDVSELEDLKEGMVLEGTITNVTNFGAFVDIGVHQDGLVHLSQMSNRFIRDPREAVKVGDVVRVKILSVEAETKRIGLSMKALLPALPRRRKKQRRRASGPASQPASKRADAKSAVPSVEGESIRAPEEAAVASAHEAYQQEERRPPSHRRRDRSKEEPKRMQPKEEEPEAPERSLQEKVAILQSKFRGIS